LDDTSRVRGEFLRQTTLSRENIFPLTVAFLTVAINYGTRGSFGLFLKPFAEEFAASRASISSILSITMLTYGSLAFFTGYLIDRFGAKVVLLVGGALAAGSFLISSMAGSLLQVTFSFGIMFGAATCFLSQITALSLLLKLPSGGNSLALGLVGSGPGIGSLCLSPSIGAMIARLSWRSAMEGISWLFVCYLLLPLLLLRQNGNRKRAFLQKEMSKSSTKTLWQGRNLPLLFVSFLLMSTAVYGVLSQEVAYATDQGMSLTEAAWALGLVTGIGVIASPLLGWISERIQSKKKLGAWILGLATLGILLIYVAKSGILLALGSIVVGTAYASYVPIFPSITRALFGQEFFGRAWGLICMGGSIGAALGSWLGGYLHDLRGNYELVWLVMALSFLAASVILLMVDETTIE
jgi:MFS family permease